MTQARVRKLFNVYGYEGGDMDGNVYDTRYLAPTLKIGGGTPRIIEYDRPQENPQ